MIPIQSKKSLTPLIPTRTEEERKALLVYGQCKYEIMEVEKKFEEVHKLPKLQQRKKVLSQKIIEALKKSEKTCFVTNQKNENGKVLFIRLRQSTAGTTVSQERIKQVIDHWRFLPDQEFSQLLQQKTLENNINIDSEGKEVSDLKDELILTKLNEVFLSELEYLCTNESRKHNVILSSTGERGCFDKFENYRNDIQELIVDFVKNCQQLKQHTSKKRKIIESYKQDQKDYELILLNYLKKCETTKHDHIPPKIRLNLSIRNKNQSFHLFKKKRKKGRRSVRKVDQFRDVAEENFFVAFDDLMTRDNNQKENEKKVEAVITDNRDIFLDLLEEKLVNGLEEFQTGNVSEYESVCLQSVQPKKRKL